MYCYARIQLQKAIPDILFSLLKKETACADKHVPSADLSIKCRPTSVYLGQRIGCNLKLKRST